MKICSLIIKYCLVLIIGASALIAQESAKTDENMNFGYSKNPPANKVEKTAVSNPEISEKPSIGEGAPEVVKSQVVNGVSNKPVFTSVAKITREIAKEESSKNLDPTEIYKVAAGDVLFVSLQESKSNYFTVLNDGSIDYPLAGGLVSVSGLTVDQIEEVLRSKVQLYENPEISVKVREYASHQIDVLGMAGKRGKLFLQREAMPLFVIRAQALAETRADAVVIRREGSEETFLTAGTPDYEEALVYPGDVVEFTSAALRAAKIGFVYVGGGVGNVGRVSYVNGMTLTQAIIAAGGITNNNARNAVVRRKNGAGFLESKTYKLSDINKGKIIDPVLEVGDLIEVDS